MKHKEEISVQKLIEGKITLDNENFISEDKKNTQKTFDTDAAWIKTKQRVEKYNKKTTLNKTLRYASIAAFILIFFGISKFADIKYNIKTAETFENIKTINLPDGSVVTLNKHSKIKYASNFKNNRTIKNLEGEAFFEVKKNPEKPFVIKTGNSSVKVLGTSFNVKNKNGITDVTVKTGKVEMKTEKQKITLKAGETGISKNKKLQKKPTDNKNYLAWKTRFFTYENEKLKNIVKDINEVYETNIIFKNPETGEIITGKTTFDNYDIDDILEIICKTHNLKCEKTKNNIILY